MNPFRVFPMEAWEGILSMLVSPRDVGAVCEAFPVLDVDIRNFKRMLLIGKVLEPLCKHLSQRDVLNLRLVCKQWRDRVNYFLVNQPYYRAYDSAINQHDNGFWNFTQGENNYVQCCSLIIFCRMLPYQINVVDQLLEYPAHYKPFVFGELSFDIGNFTHNVPDVMKIADILAKFGPTVQFLTVYITGNLRRRELDHLKQMVYAVPNMKSLNLLFTGGQCKLKANVFKSLDLPVLNHLETLDFGVFKSQFKPLVACVLKRYAPQIRRIIAPAYALTRTATTFNHLTELFLTITDDNVLETPEFQRYEQIQVLDILEAPKLVYLKVAYKSVEKLQFFISIDEAVLNWLSRFPCLIHLALVTDRINANDNVFVFYDNWELNYPAPFLSQSLKTLKIVDNEQLSYNFLHAMPNLQKLEVNTRINPYNVDESELANSSDYRRDLVANNLQLSNIWVNNLKLQMITVISNYGQPEPSSHVNVFFKD